MVLFVKKKGGQAKDNDNGPQEGSKVGESYDTTTPSFVQFYNERFIDFQNGITSTSSSFLKGSNPSVSNKQSQRHPYAVLSYSSAAANVGNSKDDQATMDIWNIRYDGSNNHKKKKVDLVKGILSETVLRSPQQKKESLPAKNERKEDEMKKNDGPDSISSTGPTKKQLEVRHLPYVITVDLNSPWTVAPLIQSVIQAIIETHTAEASTISYNTEQSACSSLMSSVEQLKAHAFGDAPGSSSETDANSTFTTKSSQKILIIFVCLLPTTEPKTYKEKQSHALVMYHLHRYASLVKGCLLFCKSSSTKGVSSTDDDEEDSEETSSGSVNGMSVEDVRDMMYQFAMFQRPNNESATNGSIAENGMTGNSEMVQIRTIYLPGDHDNEMIEGVMRRNASCEGSWDVNQDSLIKALPPPTEENGDRATFDEPYDAEYNDQVWMKQLADTVRLPSAKSSTSRSAEATGSRTAKDKSSQSAGKKDKQKMNAENKAAADTKAKDFFENLLKK